MILPCPRCLKTAKNHIVAKRHRDSQHSSQMTSKSAQFWFQNGSKIGPKMVSERVLNLLLFLGCFLGPNWTQKWSQKGSKIGPKMGSVAQMCSWSSKWAPKWTQNGSGVPKWTQNGSQMALRRPLRRGRDAALFVDVFWTSPTSLKRRRALFLHATDCG